MSADEFTELGWRRVRVSARSSDHFFKTVPRSSCWFATLPLTSISPSYRGLCHDLETIRRDLRWFRLATSLCEMDVALCLLPPWRRKDGRTGGPSSHLTASFFFVEKGLCACTSHAREASVHPQERYHPPPPPFLPRPTLLVVLSPISTRPIPNPIIPSSSSISTSSKVLPPHDTPHPSRIAPPPFTLSPTRLPFARRQAVRRCACGEILGHCYPPVHTIYPRYSPPSGQNLVRNPPPSTERTSGCALLIYILLGLPLGGVHHTHLLPTQAFARIQQHDDDADS